MNNSDKKIERITVLAKDFTPAAMEFHKKNMSAKGYRMEGTIVPRRFQIIEGVDDNARYIVKARTPTFTYVQCYSGQTVCECKEFIEAYINEPVTQEIMKLSHKKEINYKGAGTHWRTGNPMDD